MVVRLTVAILILGLAWVQTAKLRGDPEAVDVLPPLESIPAELDEWWSEDVPVTDVERRVLDADTLLHRVYRRPDGAEVWLFVAYFAAQQVNSQIHSPRNCLPGVGTVVQSVEKRPIRVGQVSKPATCMRILWNDFSGNVFYWFRTRTGTVAGEYALKWDLVKNALAGRRTDAAFMRIVSSESNEDATWELLASLESHLDRVFGQIGL